MFHDFKPPDKMNLKLIKGRNLTPCKREILGCKCDDRSGAKVIGKCDGKRAVLAASKLASGFINIAIAFKFCPVLSEFYFKKWFKSEKFSFLFLSDLIKNRLVNSSHNSFLNRFFF